MKLCNTTLPGTCLHIFWECQIVSNLWTRVHFVLSSLLKIDYIPNPGLCLLNIDSDLSAEENVVCWYYSCKEDSNTELVYTAHVWKNILGS